MDLACAPEIMMKFDCLLFFIEMSCRNFKTFEASLKACKTGFEENYDHRNFYTVNIRNNTFPGADGEFPVGEETEEG